MVESLLKIVWLLANSGNFWRKRGAVMNKVMKSMMARGPSRPSRRATRDLDSGLLRNLCPAAVVSCE